MDDTETDSAALVMTAAMLLAGMMARVSLPPDSPALKRAISDSVDASIQLLTEIDRRVAPNG